MAKQLTGDEILMVGIMRKGGVKNAERKYKDFCMVSPAGVHDYRGFVPLNVKQQIAERVKQRSEEFERQQQALAQAGHVGDFSGAFEAFIAEITPRKDIGDQTLLMHKSELWQYIGHDNAKRWWSMGHRRKGNGTR